MAQPQCSILPDTVGAGLERGDPAERGARGTRGAEPEDFVESALIQRCINLAGGKNRLDLRGEKEISVALCEKKRAHSKAIAGDKDFLAISIVDREGKLAIEPLKELCTPLLVTVNEDFGMASGAEGVATPLELMSQLRMIEDLACRCDDDLAVLIRQRLPCTAYIYDAQPDVCEANSPARIETITVWSSVPDGGGHAAERLGGDSGRRLPRNPGYPAHGTFSVDVTMCGRTISRGAQP